MTFVDYCIVGLYLLVLIGVGIFARTRISTMDDYLIAGNRFTTFSLTGTIMASLVGAGMILGVAGAVYSHGSGIVWNYIGFAAGLALFALVYVDRIRKSGGRSMAEIIAGRFGRLPRAVVGIFAAIYSFAILAMGVTGMARMFTYLSGGGIDIIVATVISVAISVILTALGGLYSVVWTDAIQFCIMVAMIVLVAPAIAIREAGSLANIHEALKSVGGSLTNPVSNVPVSYMVLVFLTMGMAVPGDPTVPQRALAGKNAGVVKKAFWISSAMSLLFGVALTVIGGAAVLLMPNIAAEYGTTEAAFPLFIMHYFPPVLTGLAIAALMSAIISTITSMLLVGTTHLLYDFGQSVFPNVQEKTFEKLIPIGTIGFGTLMTFVSLRISSIASTLYFAFSLCGGAFMIPMLATLYWNRASRWGITLGVLGGGVTVIGMSLLGYSGFGGDPVYTGLLVSLIACVTGSYAFPEKTKIA